MTHINKIFRFLLAVTMLAAFASPAPAANPDKKFFAAVTDPTTAPAVPGDVVFAVTNATPDANSTINSFIIIPPANITIERGSYSVSGPSGASASFTTVPTTGRITQLKVNAFSGLAPTLKTGSHTLKVTFRVTYDSAPCGGTAIWGAQAFAGNSWGQATFGLQPNSPDLSPDVGTDLTHTDLTMTFPNPGCSLSFTKHPSDALSGGIIEAVGGGAVTVQATPIAAFSGKSITLGFDSTPGGSPTFATGTNVATVNASGLAEFPSLAVTGLAGEYRLSATATTVAGSPTAVSNPFDIGARDGLLICPSLPLTAGYIRSYAEGDTTLTRYENKDGSVCVAIPFQLTTTTLESGGHTVEVLWDEIQQPYTALQSYTKWPFELVGPQSLPTPTKYSVDNVNTYIAPTCLSSSEPAPYGTLSAAIADQTTTSIKLSFTPTAYPLPIVVPSNEAGKAPERMLVTGPDPDIAGNSIVVRGSGRTTKSTHSAGASVMSTPLPIATSADNGPYDLIEGGSQVPVCIIKEIFTTQPFGTAGCPTPSPNTEPLPACIQTESTLWLIGDVVYGRN